MISAQLVFSTLILPPFMHHTRSLNLTENRHKEYDKTTYNVTSTKKNCYKVQILKK